MLGMKLSPSLAGPLSAAIVAGVTVAIFSQLAGLWVWAAFIGWASYDQSGEDRRALLTSSTCLVFGVVMAWLVALTVASGGLPGGSVLVSASAAALASFLIVWVARYRMLSDVPATFYGFASAFAFLLLSPGAFARTPLTSVGLQNVLVCVPISLLIGSGLGVLQVRLSQALGQRSGIRQGTGTSAAAPPPAAAQPQVRARLAR
jgi:hypothetical protein